MSLASQKIIAGNMNFIWGAISSKSKKMILTEDGPMKIYSIRSKFGGVDMEIMATNNSQTIHTFISVTPLNCGEIRSKLF
jgi:hypothetical protein